MCHSDRIKKISGEMKFQTPGGLVTIPQVSRQKCEVCEDEFFDHEANRVLDKYRGSAYLKSKKNAKKSAASKTA